jgi:hypothetical protein
MEVEGVPRYQKPNPYNYTKVQLAERTSAIRAMIKDYPTVPPMWVEWIYDVITNKPKEEVEKIINEGLWEGPGKFATAPGGVLNTVEVLNEDGTPYVFPPKETELIPEENKIMVNNINL